MNQYAVLKPEYIPDSKAHNPLTGEIYTVYRLSWQVARVVIAATVEDAIEVAKYHGIVSPVVEPARFSS